MEKELIKILENSPLIKGVFEKFTEIGFAEYYLGAGAITQTVWNHLTERAYDYGIDDLDIVYFDDDLSYEAEDLWIRKVKSVMKDLTIPVDVKNQARVHLWYEEKHKISIDPYLKLEDAINSWPTTATSIGIRPLDNGYKIYAPFGIEDSMNMVIRANKKQITEDVYDKKVLKWIKKWPELKVIKW